jgi:DNA processing protein
MGFDRSERAFWLAWGRMPRMGPLLVRRLQARFGRLELAWEATSAELAQVEGIGQQLLKGIDGARSAIGDPYELLDHHEQTNADFWTPADADYPARLASMQNGPICLYHRGQVCPAELAGTKPMVAIVGTREPSDYGRRWTQRLTMALVNQGVTIVSGMADGIDAEAHRAALAAGGRTIAVLGTGTDVIYPPCNNELYRDLLQRGLVVSEYADGTPPDRGQFPARNRIIAGLCQAVLVIEAGARSGALITADIARSLNLDLFALPGSLDNPQAKGTLQLIAQGVRPILGESDLIEALAEHLGPVRQMSLNLSLDARRDLVAPAARLPIPETLDPLARRVLELLSLEPCGLDTIVDRSQLAAGQISGLLLQLELEGLVTQLPGMQYQRVSG